VQDQVRMKLHSRRAFLAAAAGLAACATPLRALAQPPIVNAPALLENEAGGYRVLPAGQAFCGGVIAAPGHEIVHALLAPWVPLRDAWTLIQAHLSAQKRSMQALCGMELRIPEQLTMQGFRDFNAPYIEQLRKHQLIIGNYSAVCRTNVAPATDKPKEPSLHAFSYSVPSKTKARTFCISGTADIDQRGRVVAEGDTSPAGMRMRLQHCIDATAERLAQLELNWKLTTHIDLCVTRDVDELIGELLMPALDGAGQRGVRLHNARPPIVGTEVELECRGALREIVVAG